MRGIDRELEVDAQYWSGMAGIRLAVGLYGTRRQDKLFLSLNLREVFVSNFHADFLWNRPSMPKAEFSLSMILLFE